MYDDMSYKEYLYLTGMSRWTQRLPEPGELLESPHPGFMESLLHGMQRRQRWLTMFCQTARSPQTRTSRSTIATIR